jgi:tetratricopeptide (TPR) repeat protein
VGGAIRDILCGIVPVDFDFVSAGDVASVARTFAGRTGGCFFPLDSGRGVYRVVYENRDERVDFSCMRGDLLIDDLGLRDFTINSMGAELREAFDNSLPSLIDPWGGLEDLERSILRMTGAGIFDDDPLRLLRAVRIGVQFHLTIEADTFREMRRKKTLISHTSSERVRDEIFLLLKLKWDTEVLKIMHDTGILEQWLRAKIYEEIDLSRPCERWHEFFDESAALSLTRDFPALKSCRRQVDNYFRVAFCDGRTRELLTKLAVFLASGVWKTGASPVPSGTVLIRTVRELRMSRREIKFFRGVSDGCALLTSHIASGSAGTMSRYRFFSSVSDAAPVSIYLSNLQLNGDAVLEEEAIQCLEDLLIEYYQKWIPFNTLKRPVTGKDISRILGLPPGPEYRTILEEIGRLHYEGALQSRDESIEHLELLRQNHDQSSLSHKARKGMNMERTDGEKLIELGIRYGNEGKYTRAIRTFEKVLQQDRQNIDAHYNLGVIYGRCAMEDIGIEEIFEDTTGEEVLREKAITEFLEVLQRDPRHVEALNNLGTLYALNNQIDRALEMWKRSLSIDPDQGEVREEMSQYIS